MKNTFYITTTLPYVNAEPHIGFAREILQADVLARYYREKLGKENVFFNTGTDEHGQKIYQKAGELGLEPQAYCDQLAEKFQLLKETLNLSYDKFIRTTDKGHMQAAQEFWKRCDKNGYIYKKLYKVKYCVGCELEKTDSELENGHCPLHPNQEIEIIEEENYFFKFSAFAEKLAKLYKENPQLVVPEYRFREIKKFVQMGLEDFSISRLKSKMPWGVPVPGDDEQVMYVWFDALVNYISTLGWPMSLVSDMASQGENADDLLEKTLFEKFWPVVQVCGKDNIRQQSAMWQAMLMAAGLPNTKTIYINGFINSGGQKMSKSLGNVISPIQMVEKYGVDATRYLLLSMGSFGEDVDITWEKMDEKYNADLANGLGNLTSRVVTLYEKLDKKFEFTKNLVTSEMTQKNFKELKLEMELAAIFIQSENVAHPSVKTLDKYVETKKPWELAKTDQPGFEAAMKQLVQGLYYIAQKLQPFLPQTAEKIKLALETKEVQPLFQRL